VAGMKVTLLGTGSPIPDPRRAGAATLVTADGLTVLVDCGRGVIMRLAAAGVLPPMLDALLITHLHSDHITDLGDVITTRWIMSPGPRPLTIIGPVGTKEVVRLTLASLNPDVGYRIAHHDDLHEGPSVDVREVGPATRSPSARPPQPWVPPTTARSSPPSRSALEAGGKSAVLGGDGVPCAGLDELCKGADGYVQTVLRDDLVKMVPSSALPGHPRLPLDRAAGGADRRPRPASARSCSPTTCRASQPGQEDEWRALAAEHFAGPIVLGDDLTFVDL
jgi:ribonuclease Z